MAQSRSRRTARIEPLGRQPNGRYATDVRGSIYDHATGEEHQKHIRTCYAPTQDEANTVAQRSGQAWEKADSP